MYDNAAGSRMRKRYSLQKEYSIGIRILSRYMISLNGRNILDDLSQCYIGQFDCFFSKSCEKSVLKMHEKHVQSVKMVFLLYEKSKSYIPT